MSIKHHVDSLIEKGLEFQVGIRSTGQPIGPGKVEKIEFQIGMAENLPVDHPDRAVFSRTHLYRMLVPAQMQADKNSRPKTVILPIVFDIADVVLVIEAPINRDGEIAILSPNGKTPGGLHIPGA